MYARQVERLQRKRWKDANELAQEILAILGNPDLPLHHQGPITLQLPPGANYPQVRFQGGVDGSRPLEFGRRDGGQFSFDYDGGDFTFSGGAATAETAENADNASGGDGGNAFPAAVVSGSGATYQVRIEGGATVRATCQGIDASEEVPAGTAVTLVLHNGAYYFTVPLWL
jgi:hypothetical protein